MDAQSLYISPYGCAVALIVLYVLKWHFNPVRTRLRSYAQGMPDEASTAQRDPHRRRSLSPFALLLDRVELPKQLGENHDGRIPEGKACAFVTTSREPF